MHPCISPPPAAALSIIRVPHHATSRGTFLNHLPRLCYHQDRKTNKKQHETLHWPKKDAGWLSIISHHHETPPQSTAKNTAAKHYHHHHHHQQRNACILRRLGGPGAATLRFAAHKAPKQCRRSLFLSSGSHALSEHQVMPPPPFPFVSAGSNVSDIFFNTPLFNTHTQTPSKKGVTSIRVSGGGDSLKTNHPLPSAPSHQRPFFHFWASHCGHDDTCLRPARLFSFYQRWCRHPLGLCASSLALYGRPFPHTRTLFFW